MAEPSQIAFTYKEVVESLIKRYGIKEGIWGIYIRFGIHGANLGPSASEVRPAAIIPVLEIGLQKMEEESNIAVDASKIRGQETTPKAKKRGRAR
jgi:hypothetical protein